MEEALVIERRGVKGKRLYTVADKWFNTLEEARRHARRIVQPGQRIEVRG